VYDQELKSILKETIEQAIGVVEPGAKVTHTNNSKFPIHSPTNHHTNLLQEYNHSESLYS
jgi:hypothetical protein